VISQNKEKNARQINNASQSSSTPKKDKIKTVLALINELQVQDSIGSDEEIDTLPSPKTALVCNLAQVPPEIWMTLSLEAKKWVLNERKRQQQEEDKSKKSSEKLVEMMHLRCLKGTRTLLNERKRQQQEEDKSKKSSETNGNDAVKMSERNKNTSSRLTNQYKEEVQDDTDHNYGFVYEFLEEALNTSNSYEAQQDTEYDFWISDHNVHTSISINNTLYNKCMNLLFLPENHHISILDGDADTCFQAKVGRYYQFITQEERMWLVLIMKLPLNGIFQLLVQLPLLIYPVENLFYW
jgi:hypothetical protein